MNRSPRKPQGAGKSRPDGEGNPVRFLSEIAGFRPIWIWRAYIYPVVAVWYIRVFYVRPKFWPYVKRGEIE